MCHFEQKLTRGYQIVSPICSGCESLTDEFIGKDRFWTCCLFDEVLGEFEGLPVRCPECESEPDD